MPATSLHSFLQTKPPIKVWVLAPQLPQKDENIDYYYDFSQSIAEYDNAFAQLGLPWQWQPVRLDNYHHILDRIKADHIKSGLQPVIFNLCDGDEVNDAPGISVIRYMDQLGLTYTGSDEYFYQVTTSKIPMKRAFERFGVPTARWKTIFDPELDHVDYFGDLGSPMIIKPAVSGGSMGIGTKNVVSTQEELQLVVQELFSGYRGWNLTADGLIVEAFIDGPEFTTLISGSHNRPEEARIYTPVERVFHPSVPDKEKFLSFDRLWEMYEKESPMPGGASFYEYALPDPAIREKIRQVSWDAYCSVQGHGYTRVDLRMDRATGQLYVLEVNAQCGLSEDEDYTSIGAILRLGGCTFAQLVAEIIRDALLRQNPLS